LRQYRLEALPAAELLGAAAGAANGLAPGGGAADAESTAPPTLRRTGANKRDIDWTVLRLPSMIIPKSSMASRP